MCVWGGGERGRGGGGEGGGGSRSVVEVVESGGVGRDVCVCVWW